MGAFAPVTNSLQPPSDYVHFQQSYMSTFRCRCFPLLHSCMMRCLLADSDKHVRGRHGDEPEASGCRPASRHHRREPQSHAGQSLSSAQSPAAKQCTRYEHDNIVHWFHLQRQLEILPSIIAHRVAMHNLEESRRTRIDPLQHSPFTSPAIHCDPPPQDGS